MARRILIGIAALPLLALAAPSVGGAAAAPRALLVGSYNGIPGQYATIQDAVNAAAPGDWVLVGPGDYHEQGYPKAGVWITTANLHLRGMNRNTVIVDGTKPGSAMPCDPNPALQTFGPAGSDGKPAGLNGVEVWKADGVSIENLTVCNYLSSDGGDNGNEIWWNGGDGSGTVNLNSLSGAYLTASSSYYKDNNSAQGKYGIFTSNERGPGVIAHTYASNMGDSAYYIGACPDCNVDLTDPHAENSALGYSGTNGSGHLIIENGEWDNNKAGIAPNTLNNDDAPSPQDGACPNGGTGPTGSHSCTIIRNNYVHDNNNPNTPQFGIAGAAPVGVGIILSGDRNDTVVNNKVVNQMSWGVVVNDFPDTETPPSTVTTPCAGGMQLPGGICYYVAFGNEVAHNTFSNNGGFGNPSNGDIADDHIQAMGQLTSAGNCYHDNTDTGGTVSSDPPLIQTIDGTCGVPNVGDNTLLTAQLVCASGPVLNIGGVTPQCPGGTPAASYPQSTGVRLTAIPHNLVSMPDPCAGVPSNPWCGGAPSVAASNSVSSTPNTEAARASAWVYGAGGVVLLIAGVVGLRRRRRI